MSQSPGLDPATLAQFTGSQEFYRHPIVHDIIFTEGAKYVADTAGAYWLLDQIALAQRCIPSVTSEEFQIWTLTVKPDLTATLNCGDGDGHVVFSEPIEFTDFPVEEFQLYFCNNCIHLPSEY